MNKTKTSTVDKVTFPLRLPPKMYKQIREKVNENYAYSINDFLTEIIEKGLKEKRQYAACRTTTVYATPYRKNDVRNVGMDFIFLRTFGEGRD